MNKTKRKAGPGRPKGSLNASSIAAKTAFQLAFQGLGGVEALTSWAKGNEGEFYKLYARLIPTETHLTGSEGAPLGIVILPRKDIAEYVEAHA